MPPLRVGRANVSRLLYVTTNEPIDDGALPYPGRPEQRSALAGRQILRNLVQALIEFRADDMDGRVSGDDGDLGNPRRNVVADVRLRQQHDWRGAALTSQQQISLEPARAEVVVERHDDEHDVNVGGHDLFIRHMACHATREPTAARQHGDDRAAVFVGTLPDNDPVADTGSSLRLVARCDSRPDRTASISPPSHQTRQM